MHKDGSVPHRDKCPASMGNHVNPILVAPVSYSGLCVNPEYSVILSVFNLRGHPPKVVVYAN